MTTAEKEVDQAIRFGQVLASEKPKYMYLASRNGDVWWKTFLASREKLNDGSTFVGGKRPTDLGLTTQEKAMCAALGLTHTQYAQGKRAWERKTWNDHPRDAFGRRLDTNERVLAVAGGKR